MRHTLYRATFTPHEVEVPEKCPDCGADFAAHGALVEGNYQDCWVKSHIEAVGTDLPGTTSHDPEPPVEEVTPEGETNYGDTYYPVGLICSACDWQLEPEGA